MYFMVVKFLVIHSGYFPMKLLVIYTRYATYILTLLVIICRMSQIFNCFYSLHCQWHCSRPPACQKLLFLQSWSVSVICLPCLHIVVSVLLFMSMFKVSMMFEKMPLLEQFSFKISDIHSSETYQQIRFIVKCDRNLCFLENHQQDLKSSDILKY